MNISTFCGYICILWILSTFCGNIHVPQILSAFCLFYLSNVTNIVKVTGASQGLHQGRQLQDRLDERACTDVGKGNWHNQGNHGEISPGELCRGGTLDPIRVNITTMRHLGHRVCICGSVLETFIQQVWQDKACRLIC